MQFSYKPNLAKIGIRNLQRIQFDKFEKDFSFIVNGKIYKTNSFVANILSPNISKMFNENINISYYEINPKYDGDFNRIIEYGEMKAININNEDNKYFENVMQILGNKLECFHLNKVSQEEISYENVIQRIRDKNELDLDLYEEIAFISSHFHDFNIKYPEALSQLDIDVIEEILSNQQLQILDEEELFDIILQLYMKSKEYSTLFSYIIFINLSTESIRKFKENFDINDMNNSIWTSVCTRLEQNISNESTISYHESHQEFFNKRYNRKRYEHILEHLSEECHGNVHTIANITSSSIYNDNDNFKTEYIISQNPDNYFGTKNEANSWIQFDFKERKVLLDHYSLKTINADENSEHLKNWIFEVSNDGENYTVIDQHKNCDLLKGGLKTATFKVSCPTPQRFLRLTQTGPNWSGNNCLNIKYIEFSGFLYERFI